jgi:hypothetical protein
MMYKDHARVDHFHTLRAKIEVALPRGKEKSLALRDLGGQMRGFLHESGTVHTPGATAGPPSTGEDDQIAIDSVILPSELLL